MENHNSSVSLPSNCEYSPIVHDHLDANEEGKLQNYSRESNGKVHQFYFVKLQNFIDPALKAKLEMATKLREELLKAKESIKTNTYPLKEQQIKYNEYYAYKSYRDRRRDAVEHLKSCKDHYGLEAGRRISNKSDARQHPKSIEIDEKIQKLKYGAIHGTRNVAEERKNYREIQELQRMKEQMNAHQTSTIQRPQLLPSFHYFAKTHPLPTSNSKQDIQRYIQSFENKLRVLANKEREAKKRYERKLAELENNLMSKEEDLSDVNSKIFFVNKRILAAQTQLDEQTSYYGKYIVWLTMAKELAAKKDLMALEELSKKQVEEFMYRWNNDDDFRARYAKSVLRSLDSRNLSNDGRRRNVGEKLTAYDVPGKQKFTWPMKINPL